MKLSECKIGTLVQYDSNEFIRIGHIVGLQYNIRKEDIYAIPEKERINYVIPVVRWVNGEEYGIHHKNIKIFKD